MSRWTLRGDALAGRGVNDNECQQQSASLGRNDDCTKDESRRVTPSRGTYRKWNCSPGRISVNPGHTPRRGTTPIGPAAISQTTGTRLRPASSRTAPLGGRSIAARPTACPTSVPPTSGDTANISLLPRSPSASEWHQAYPAMNPPPPGQRNPSEARWGQRPRAICPGASPPATHPRKTATAQTQFREQGGRAQTTKGHRCWHFVTGLSGDPTANPTYTPNNLQPHSCSAGVVGGSGDDCGFATRAAQHLAQHNGPATTSAFKPQKLVTATDQSQGKPRSLMQPQPMADVHPFALVMQIHRGH